MVAKQNQDRQKLQQKQDKEHQQLTKQKAAPARMQQVEQQHQQQTQQMQQGHTQQMQQMQQRQQSSGGGGSRGGGGAEGGGNRTSLCQGWPGTGRRLAGPLASRQIAHFGCSICISASVNFHCPRWMPSHRPEIARVFVMDHLVLHAIGSPTDERGGHDEST